jgi:hypothetical protein
MRKNLFIAVLYHFTRQTNAMKKIIIAIVSFYTLLSFAKAQTPAVVVYSDSPAVAPSLLMQGVKDNCVYKFMLKVSSAPAILTGVRFTTNNTSATDFENYRLFWGTSNSLKESKTIARIVDSLGSGSHTFNLTTSPLVLTSNSQPYYFFITSDVADSGKSTVANTLIFPAAIKGADLSFIGTTPAIKDSSFPGGNQTIVPNTSFATVTPNSTKDTSARDVVTNQLMFLNAANFDFSGQLASNYVGHVNIYAPHPVDHGFWKFMGFNVGIMKLNYSNNDTVQAQKVTENVLIDPLQKPIMGSKYLRQLNVYSTQIKQTAWSFYAQPLFQLTDSASNQKVFVHGHFELLVNKYTTTTSVNNIRTDTAVVDSSASVFRSDGNNQTSFNNKFLDGYFGVGLTFDLQPYKSAEFFFQPTVGWTTGIPTLSPLNTQAYNNRQISVTKKWYMFYLVRSYYIQKLSGMSTLVLGTDIRGFFPKNAPQLATYIGLNVNVNDVIKLLGISNK